jgi:hypothetical protein
MPLPDDQRVQQTTGVGEVFVIASRAPALSDQNVLRTMARVQGAMALALGVEVGFFDKFAAAHLLDVLALRADVDVTTLGIHSSPLLADRVRQIAEQGLVTPGYRSRLSDSDSSQISLRSALLPIVRAWQSPLYLPALFERITSGMGTSEDPATIGDALRYLATATQAIRAAAEGAWLPKDALFARDSWLVAELAMLYQVQADTSRRAVKFRLRQLAEELATSTVQETRQIILAEPVNEMTQAEWLAQLERRSEEWRADALNIVEQFDAAIPAAATA